jgi:radial spoke head protein 4A
LNASIDSNPPFPGKERHFLRAQIARITHATVIIPKGLYEMDDETNQEKFAEEFAVPATEEMKSLETWAHRHPVLLKAGRITHLEPVGLPEDEKDEYMGKLAETDPTVDRYRTLNEDAPITGLETAWLSKLVGD